MAFELGLVFTDYDTCSNLYVYDSSGTYNSISNPTGYGTPNPPTSTITSAILTLTYNSLGNQTAVFTFTVVSNVVTAATLEFAGGAPTNILANLQSTVFPFTELNPFNFGRDYGTTLPSLEDGVYSVEYEIIGNSGGAYSYTATETICVKCNTEACIKNIYLTAGINSEILDRAYQAQKFLDIAGYNAAAGDAANATVALNRASQICDEDLSNCGCG